MTSLISGAAHDRFAAARTAGGVPTTRQAQTSAASGRRTPDASAAGSHGFRLSGVSWEIQPEPADAAEREALLTAAEQALAAEGESVWWRSGLDDLGGGPATKQAWSGAGVVEP